MSVIRFLFSIRLFRRSDWLLKLNIIPGAVGGPLDETLVALDDLALEAAGGILEQALTTDFRQRIALQIKELVVGGDAGTSNQHGVVQLFSDNSV